MNDAKSGSTSDIEKADLAVADSVGEKRHRPWVRVAGTLSEVADQPQLATVCGLVLAAGLIRRDRRLARTGTRMLAAFALATWGKSLVKHRVKRTRPHVLKEEGRYEMRAGKAQGSEEGSFPSGHTAGAVAVAGAVGREYPGLALPAYGAAALIALIQLPRAKHYPSDLAAGLGIGLASSALAALGFRLLARGLAEQRDEPSHGDDFWRSVPGGRRGETPVGDRRAARLGYRPQGG